MLNAILRFSLNQRALVGVISLFLLLYGGNQILQLPIDVFPDLNRPRVVVMVEAHGMAPEEVESLLTIPIEASLGGATGVQAIRSSSMIGLSVINVEFDWGTDVFQNRQIVNERIASIAAQLPPETEVHLAPISSIMGQIMIAGIFSKSGETDPMELRTQVDWVVRRRLLTIPGVAQVFVMGGERKQYQVLVNPRLLLQYNVTLHEVKTALRDSNRNTSGGYLDEQGPNELLVRIVGRVTSKQDIREIVIKNREGRSVLLSQVAEVTEAAQTKRGDSSTLAKDEQGEFQGGSSIVLTISKQPGADTRTVTNEIERVLKVLKQSLPHDVVVQPNLYQQKQFIDRAIENVIEALRDGSLLVVIILFLFLFNFRTTIITLTAIPLSIVISGLIFTRLGLAINTMTLGGLAVAMGELVDDAIVDVENCLRRLQENSRAGHPRSFIYVVYSSSVEIRNSIVFGTIIVVLVFLPLFALSGMEGRLFQPLGIAYIVSILASLLVSLTLTPVMCFWLLKKANLIEREHDGLFLRLLKGIASVAIKFSLTIPRTLLILVTVLTIAAGLGLYSLEKDFLPPFNEGSVQVNVVLPPGSSLSTSNEINKIVEKRLRDIPYLQTLVRRTGRAEMDEHAAGVNISEYIVTFDPHSEKTREEINQDLRQALKDVPGVVGDVEQPISHLISHMLSGVKAQIGIKLYGDDLDILRAQAQKLKSEIEGIPGVQDLLVEPQVIIPQLRIEVDGDQLKHYGLKREEIVEYVETAMQGHVLSQILIDQRSFDLLIRFNEKSREDLEAIRRLQVTLPGGGTTKLETVARIYRAGGPNTVNRENGRRRIIVQCNVSERGLVDVVQDIQSRLITFQEELPLGYYLEFSGQFESQQKASRTISILFCGALLLMFFVLYIMFGSANLALQVMIALPMAFIGSVFALYYTHQRLSIASMVGFISLCGIAARNGILLINHYLYLVREEQYEFTKAMIVKAGQDRLAPVLMTALTSGIGLIPLALAAGEPGKEILYPVATVIIGGLISSTVLEFLVRPALFWKYGVSAATKVVNSNETASKLTLDEIALYSTESETNS